MKKLLTTLLAAAGLLFGSAHAALAPDTSANPITPAFSNGEGAGSWNVSKGNSHQYLLPADTGFKTKVMVHWLPWFDGGNDSGINVNYSTSDPTYVWNFLTDVWSRGFDGVNIDWMGQNDITNSGALVLQQKIQNATTQQNNAPMTFALVMDAQLLGEYTGTNTQRLVSALNYVTTQYTGDSHYEKYNGKPVIFDFGLNGDISGYGTGTIDWATIQADFPNLQWVHQDDACSCGDGYSIADSAGSMLWVEPYQGGLNNPNNTNLSWVDSFYTRAATHPTQITSGALFMGFNPVPYATWDPTEYISQNNGQTWLQTWAKANAYIAAGHPLQYLQVETWDDYYEGTAMEVGVWSGADFNPTVSGATINYNMTGPTNSLYDIEVYASYDGGTTWSVVAYQAPTATSYTATRSGLYGIKLGGYPTVTCTGSNTLTVTVP